MDLSWVHAEKWVPDTLKVGFTVVVGYYAVYINRKNKMVDVITHCTARYDNLQKLRSEVASEYAAILYYRQYWTLKSDQLDYWMAGLVDPETIASWFFQVLESFERERDRLKDLREENEFLLESKGQPSYFFPYSAGWTDSYETHERLNPRLSRMVLDIFELAGKRHDKQEKFMDLLNILGQAEQGEKEFIAFTSISIRGLIRRRDIAAYTRMEKRRRKKIQEEKRTSNDTEILAAMKLQSEEHIKLMKQKKDVLA